MRWIYRAALLALSLPLALIVVTSLTNATFVGFPLRGFSWRWYAAAIGNPENDRAFLLSTGLAVLSAALAVVAGTWIALAAEMLTSLWRWLLFGAMLVPLVTPGIVHAIALRIAIKTIGLDPGPMAVLLGHVVHATPLAAIMIAARLTTTPTELVDAARDLGAGPIAVFRHVHLPWLGPTMAAVGVLAGLNSFDDFVRSYFLGGYDQTLPVLIFGRLHSGLTPEINALAALSLILAAVTAIVIFVVRRSIFRQKDERL